MALKQWPTVTDRNVAQPSRVRLTTAPEAGPDAYDVTPIPGTVTAEGTLINKALFTGQKEYIDTKGIPTVVTTGTGSAYLVNVPEWNGITMAELDGKLLCIKPHVDSTSTTPTIKVNGLGEIIMHPMVGQTGAASIGTPTAASLVKDYQVLLLFSTNGSTPISCRIVNISMPYGGAYASNAWALSKGGTGKTTAFGANNAIIGVSTNGTAATVDTDKFLMMFASPSDGAGASYYRTGTQIAPWIVEKARIGLGFNSAGVLPITKGGTGATSQTEALNSLKTYALFGRIELPDNADLNTITTVGNYNSATDVRAKTILNTPWGAEANPNARAFILTVESSTGNANSYLRQIYIDYYNKIKYIRHSIGDTPNWDAWIQVSSPTHLPNSPWNTGQVGTTGQTNTVSVKALSQWNGAYGNNGKSNLTRLGTVQFGAWQATPVAVGYGGTGGNTAAAARSNLSVPNTTVLSGASNTQHIKNPDASEMTYLAVGSTNTSAMGGLIPPVANTNTGHGYIGASTFPFFRVVAKQLQGSLATSNLSGVVSVANGGTGGNTLPLAAANMQTMYLGAGLTTLADNTDLNTITTFGVYSCTSNVGAITMLNKPAEVISAFRLIVECSVPSNSPTFIRQRIQGYYPIGEVDNRGAEWQRTSASGGTAWSGWSLANATGYASTTRAGFIKVGTNLSINNGVLSATAAQYTLPQATTTTLGGVKVDGSTITINSAGVITATGGGPSGYTLPPASASTLGGIKVGSGLSVTADGTLSAASVTYPISVANGGTGANTAAGARANLGAATYVLDSATDKINLAQANGTVPKWLVAGTASENGAGLCPAKADTTNGWGQIGTSGWPFNYLYAKVLNGSLAASNITGVLPLANGGTGGNTQTVAVNNLGAYSITNRIGLQTNDDLNNYKSFGNYVCSNDVVSNTILNTPWGTAASSNANAFNLTVVGSIGGSTTYLRQILKPYHTVANGIIYYGVTYERTSENSGTSWTPWIQTQGSGYANANVAGLVRVGSNLSITNDGVLSATNTTYGLATTSANGLMSSTDKTKLNGIATGANNYSLPVATGSVLGGVKQGTNVSIASDGTISATDTKYTLPTATASVLGGVKIGAGLSAPSGVLTVGSAGVLPVANGGTGGNTPNAARAGLNLIGGNMLSTGSDSQVLSVTKVGPHCVLVEMLVNVSAVTGANAQVQLGSVTLPYPVSYANLNSAGGYMNISTEYATFTDGSTMVGSFVITNEARTNAALNVWVQQGKYYSGGKIHSTIMYATATNV